MYKVLLVDDEPLVREYLRLHIASNHPDWEVAGEAMDGQEAWDMLQDVRVHLVITDIKMPVVDGLELCRRLSQSENPPIILILSGFDEFSLARDALRFGVQNYLLKPVVHDELAEALAKVTAQLDRKFHEELAALAMGKVSKESQTQVVRQFLKSLVSDDSVEIKALYPLVFRLKVQLIETEGLIMVLDLDEDRLAQKGIPYGDISVFRFILNQMTGELSEASGSGFVFLDEDQHTCVLVTGEDKNDIEHKCRSLYGKVSSAMLANTGITVSGALGTFESELFHLQYSHAKATETLNHRLFMEEPSLFNGWNEDVQLQRLAILEQTLSSLQFAIPDRNEAAFLMAVKRFFESLPHISSVHVMKFGLYLLRQLANGPLERQGGFLESAYHHLQQMHRNPSELSIQAVLGLFQEIFHRLTKGGKEEPVHENEQDIVSRVRTYIYSHYAEPLSLALLAEKMGISPGYLSSIFHKTMQESYIKFLTRVRMEQAAKLLKANPPVKVYDVSEKVGYVSVKHFSHVFKQFHHMPPGEYQEKHLSAAEWPAL
ncbi:two-component system, response regulator YesN [Paenibacillus sophorae]|uniref:Response regulator n=1 Tax=Paenibacillus sophorae TaxID=1333845 RepID=A0A1H8JFT0_9BACL|nr:response regulator [Paenibacillus sophorae]QWU13353.1 response regulator [Paenibacillus sophorae]SEN79703.1 two-component system, response regulator YesN [Paenibacillus sophorae]